MEPPAMQRQITELEQRDDLITQLEALVEDQRAEIVRLRALAEGGAGTELQELHAIVEAQEAALQDQRQVMESQSSLVDELNRQLQAQTASLRHEEELEGLLEQQRTRIAQLEALVETQGAPSGDGSSPQEELQHLRAIIEAQESALNDQRQVITSQSSLIDELSSNVQLQMAGRQREPATPRPAPHLEDPGWNGADGAAAAAVPGSTAGPLAATSRCGARRRPMDGASPPAFAPRAAPNAAEGIWRAPAFAEPSSGATPPTSKLCPGWQDRARRQRHLRRQRGQRGHATGAEHDRRAPHFPRWQPAGGGQRIVTTCRTASARHSA
mmetsp:Transcript_48960/g.151167  ORF Transcript_48960/g.151167 Transcript_48960/m.151167 type:complete len:326 (-) Transcript_48960:245-1222(-)